MASLHRNVAFLSYGIPPPYPAPSHPSASSDKTLAAFASHCPRNVFSSFRRSTKKKILVEQSSGSLCFHLQIFAEKTTSPSPSLPLLPSPGRFYFSKQPRTDSLYSRLQSLGQNTEPMIARTVPVQVAHELLNAGHRYLDVRTPEEFKSAHIDGAINIPYMYRAGSGMSKNHAFLSEMMAQFDKDDEIVVGCQSGKRSQMAAAELMAMGFALFPISASVVALENHLKGYTGVADMAGGYLAWIQSGLSTTR